MDRSDPAGAHQVAVPNFQAMNIEQLANRGAGGSLNGRSTSGKFWIMWERSSCGLAWPEVPRCRWWSHTMREERERESAASLGAPQSPPRTGPRLGSTGQVCSRNRLARLVVSEPIPGERGAG